MPKDNDKGIKDGISVVIPVHNEGQNIVDLIQEICLVLEGNLDFELVVVDDGSTDQTRKLLTSLLADCPRLRLFFHDCCYGQSTALWTGVRMARQEIIVTLDGDGQNDPRDILKLIARYWQEPVAVWREHLGPANKRDIELKEIPIFKKKLLVAGFRRKRKDGLWRLLSSKVANTVRRALLKDGTPDTGCGLKICSRELFLALPYFDHFHRFLPALVKRAGGEVISVEVQHRQRRHGTSHYGTWDRLRDGLVDLFAVFWLIKRARQPRVVCCQAGSEKKD